MGDALTAKAVFVADAGKAAGLGHVSRSSAVAVALNCRGIETAAYGFGLERALDRDGVLWKPAAAAELPRIRPGETLVLDSYTLGAADFEVAGGAHVVVLQEHTEAPDRADVVVSVGGDRDGDDRVLRGLEYACLRPAFWGVPRRAAHGDVEQVLVATGAGDFGGAAAVVARDVQAAVPDARVTLVAGPYAGETPDEIEILRGSEDLSEVLAKADVAVVAAGQTLLEAAASGCCCVGLVMVENQRRQAGRLAERGAVVLAGPEAVGAAVRRLAADADLRSGLVRRAQEAVDGFGALRVAYRIATLDLERVP